MIVTVDSNLYYIKQYLESTGRYEIYDIDQYIGQVHACIYEKENNEKFIELQNNLISLAQNEHVDIRHGVLMINAKNKTPKEIEKILSERLYENVF